MAFTLRETFALSSHDSKSPQDANEERLAELADAMADSAVIDWDAESERTPTLRRGLKHLRDIEGMIKAVRAIGGTMTAQREPMRTLFDWGPFSALELVGEGAFGQVYRAFDSRLRREVALKLRRADAGGPNDGNRHFLEEARHLARVRHSNVLVVHGADVHDGRAGFWTDFIRGRTLASLLDEGPIEQEAAVRIGIDLCHALQAVHAAGLVHGDIKASNVMREDGGRVLLTDFGAVTRVAADGSSLGLGQLFGTPLVLAPEVLRGNPPDPPADLYSLGVLLHFMLTKSYPVNASSVAELIHAHARRSPRLEALDDTDVSSAFVRVLERALALDPAARYASAQDLELDLLSLLPASPDADTSGQSLRALMNELGRVPERMSRSIGAEIVSAILREPMRDHAGDLNPDQVFLLPDGRVRLSRRGRTVDNLELPGLVRLLHELATGRSKDSIGEPFEEGTVLSPFLKELLQQTPSGSSGIATLPALLDALCDGERGTWWRGRRKDIHRGGGPSRPRIARDTSLHGRSDAIAHLRHSFEKARSGAGQVLLLSGEPGIGKTRLADELIVRLEQDGADFQYLFGSYPPGGGVSDIGAFSSAYQAFLGEDDLEETLASHLADTPLLVAPLLSLLAGQGTPEEANRSNRDLLRRALIQLTESLAKSRPTVIWIDDLHFAPDDGRELFALLGQAVASHRVLLLGTTRPTLPPEWRANLLRMEHAEELDVSQLQIDDVRRLLTEALDSAPLANELAPELMKRSDGNPLFLFEYLRSLGAVGRIDRSSLAQVRYQLRDLSTPGTIRRLIQARFASLADEDQEILDVASCLGFDFDPELIARALGYPVLPVLRRLARIERDHRLVRSAGRGYGFDHHETQQALYQGLFEPLREEYHVALARAAEQRGQAGAEGASSVFLAEHFLRGRAFADAAPYLRPALDHLEGIYQNDAAVQLSDLALAPEGLLVGRARSDVLSLKARCLALLGRVEAEEATLQDLFRAAEASGDPASRAEAHVLLGDRELRHSNLEQAEALLQVGLGLAEEVGDLAVQQFATLSLGTVFLHQGQYENARLTYERALGLARRRRHLRGEASALVHFGIALGSQDRLEEAWQVFEQVLALSREAGFPIEGMLALGNLGVTAGRAGRFAEACVFHEENLALAQQIGFRRNQGTARSNWGASLFSLGNSAAALEQLEHAIPLLREAGFRFGEASAAESLGTVFAALGAWQEARNQLDRAVSVSREIGNPKDGGDALVSLGKVEHQAGALDRAEQYFRDALALYESIDYEQGIASAVLALGILSAGRNEREVATDLLRRAFDIARGDAAWSIAVPAAIHLSLLTGGDLASARSLLSEHGDRLGLSERMEAFYLLWCGAREATDLEEARRLLDQFEQQAPERFRVSLNEVSLYRSIRSGTATEVLTTTDRDDRRDTGGSSRKA